ncbi:hypothetical protein FOZ61_001947, partial [Perkinsus olseni]
YKPPYAMLNYVGSGGHKFVFIYDDVTIDDGWVILKRYGKEEGFKLFPYFSFEFELEVDSGVLYLQPIDGGDAFEFTRDCEELEDVSASCSSVFNSDSQVSYRDTVFSATLNNDTVSVVMDPSIAMYVLTDSRTYADHTGPCEPFKRDTSLSFQYMNFTCSHRSYSQDLVRTRGHFAYDKGDKIFFYYLGLPDQAELPPHEASTDFDDPVKIEPLRDITADLFNNGTLEFR